MNDPSLIEDGGDGLGQPERDVADRLGRERPVPMAAFRGALGRHLAARDPGYGPRPPRLRVMVAGYAAAGSLALIAGALQATGVL